MGNRLLHTLLKFLQKQPFCGVGDLLPSRTVYDNVAYALQVTGGTRK